MSHVTVIMKDGTREAQEMWTWRPKEGWFQLVDGDRIELNDVARGTITDRFTVEGVTTKQLLDYAKECGYVRTVHECEITIEFTVVVEGITDPNVIKVPSFEIKGDVIDASVVKAVLDGKDLPNPHSDADGYLEWEAGS